MFDMVLNSIKLFVAGKLFRDNWAFFRQLGAGFAVTLALMLALGASTRPGPPRRLSDLGVFLCKSTFYGPFVRARRALNRRKWRFPARAVALNPKSTKVRPIAHSPAPLPWHAVWSHDRSNSLGRRTCCHQWRLAADCPRLLV